MRQTVPIAAICAATVAIARLGLLRGRQHTSNGLKYLQLHVPEYHEAQNYVEAPAVRDRGLITASGIADIEFARELFEEPACSHRMIGQFGSIFFGMLGCRMKPEPNQGLERTAGRKQNSPPGFHLGSRLP